MDFGSFKLTFFNSTKTRKNNNINYINKNDNKDWPQSDRRNENNFKKSDVSSSNMVRKKKKKKKKLTVVASDKNIAVAVYLLVVEKLLCRLKSNIHKSIDRLQLAYIQC